MKSSAVKSVNGFVGKIPLVVHQDIDGSEVLDRGLDDFGSGLRFAQYLRRGEPDWVMQSLTQ